MSSIDRVLGHFRNAKRNGDGWQATCPAHDDSKPSLSIKEGRDGRVLVKCHAGCAPSAIVSAGGLTLADLFDASASNGNGTRPHDVATYPYLNEAGAHLFDVVRFEPKAFKQRAASGVWKMAGVRRVPYHLPQVLAGIKAGRHVLIVEGEKDVEALAAFGLVATTNSGGAGKWRAEYNEHFRGARVAIVPDNDQPGREHALDVARHLFSVAKEIRVVELPNLPEKGDVSDWLSAGGTADELKALVRSTPALTAAPTRVETERARPSIARLEIVSMADVVSRPIHWIWPNYFPLGKLVVIDGLPGQGKSTVTLDIAARGSQAKRMPDGSSGLGTPWASLILSYEDDPGDTMCPKLEAAGADLSRIGIIKGVSYNGEIELVPPTLPKDLAAIDDELARRPDIRLFIIDPVMAAISADVDSHRDQDIRRPLARLARMAAERNVCIIIVRHVRKGHGGNAIYAGGGSVGISGQARVVLIVEQHPDDPASAILAVAKSNVGPIPSALTFRRTSTTVMTAAGDIIDTARLEWTGTADLSADELLAARGDGEPSDSKDAADWLRDLLSQGRLERQEIIRTGETNGFGKRMLERTAQRIGAVKSREGFGASMKSYWALPAPSSCDRNTSCDTVTTPVATVATDPFVATEAPDEPEIVTDPDGTQRFTAAGKARSRAERDAKLAAHNVTLAAREYVRAVIS